MNYLVTLNIGHFLTPNAAESMIAAANRWGCEFHEITDNWVGNQACEYNKYVGLYRLLKKPGAQSAMFLDADTLVRSDAPNPFTEATIQNPSLVYGVLDAAHAPEYQQWFDDVIGQWWFKVDDMLRYPIESAVLRATAKDWFINAGCFIVTQYTLDELAVFAEHIPTDRCNGRMEQCLWNYILKAHNRIGLLDKTWNKIQPDLSTGTMKDFVYHFTGPIDTVKVKAQVATYDWRTAP